MSLGIARKTFKILRVSEKNARQYKFDLKQKETGEILKDISVEEYFQRKYNIVLEWPEFPVLETTKRGTVYPMETAIMLGGQRYPYKLNESQVGVGFSSCRKLTNNCSVDDQYDQVRGV